MSRPYHEPYDPEDIFDRADADERRARREEAQKLNAERDAVEAEQAARRSASARVNSMRANARILLSEYHAAGVEPMQTRPDGTPTVSLSLLRSMGWTIVQIDDRNVLVAPAARPTKPGKQRQDYDQSS